MRLRPALWSEFMLLALVALAIAWAVASPHHHWMWPAYAAPLTTSLLSLWRAHVLLSPEGIRRGYAEERAFVTWDRIQAVALAGDTAGVCPTLWTDDRREIALSELAKGRGSDRKVQRNAERIRSHWELFRGPSWQPAPWVSDVVPGWVPGASATPDAVTPAAITARLRPAWGTWAAYAALASLPVTSAPVRGNSWTSWDDWPGSVEPLFVLLVVALLWGFFHTTGARLSAYGLERGRGAIERVPWPRVQRVEVAGGRWFARPTVWADDGRALRFVTLGVIFGLGRERANRVCQRIERAWLDHRGPAWRPLSPPAPLPPPPPAPQRFPVRSDVNYWAPPPT